jgi:hypothetical protein
MAAAQRVAGTPVATRAVATAAAQRLTGTLAVAVDSRGSGAA